jgi:hypothetical protein
MKTKGVLIWVCVCVIVTVILVPFITHRDGGYVLLEGPGATVRLRGGLFNRVTVGPGSKPREVPAGRYTPAWLTLAAHRGSNTWRLQSTGPWGELANIKIKKGETEVVKLGPPLKIKPETRVSGRNVSVGLAIFGQAGEKYRNVITMNGSAMPSPKVKIIDQDGKVLASGRLEYG